MAAYTDHALILGKKDDSVFDFFFEALDFLTRDNSVEALTAMALKVGEVNLKEVIQAAIEVFSKSNFQNSSIAEIAKKARVAEGTIYQYFKNKEDLFFRSLLKRRRSFPESWNSICRG
jgi:DNA-binding phage protein